MTNLSEIAVAAAESPAAQSVWARTWEATCKAVMQHPHTAIIAGGVIVVAGIAGTTYVASAAVRDLVSERVTITKRRVGSLFSRSTASEVVVVDIDPAATQRLQAAITASLQRSAADQALFAE